MSAHAAPLPCIRETITFSAQEFLKSTSLLCKRNLRKSLTVSATVPLNCANPGCKPHQQPRNCLDYLNNMRLTLLLSLIWPCVHMCAQLFRAVVPHNDAWLHARTADERQKMQSLRQEATSLKALFSSWSFLIKVATLALGWVLFFGKCADICIASA